MMLCASSGMVGSIPMRFRHLTWIHATESLTRSHARARLGPGDLGISCRSGHPARVPDGASIVEIDF